MAVCRIEMTLEAQPDSEKFLCSLYQSRYSTSHLVFWPNPPAVRQKHGKARCGAKWIVPHRCSIKGISCKAHEAMQTRKLGNESDRQ